MSLACFECDRIGSFDVLVLISKKGFDIKKPVSEYRNFYTCCANFDDFKKVKQSNFMVVKEKTTQSCWNTGNDGDKIKDTQYKYISEETLKQKLPKIYEALIGGMK